MIKKMMLSVLLLAVLGVAAASAKADGWPQPPLPPHHSVVGFHP